MPAADAVAALPRFGLNLIRGTSLHVPNQSLSLLVVLQYFAEDYCLVLSSVGRHAVVVHVCGDLHSCIAYGIEGKHGDIEIEQVGIVTINSIERAVVEVSGKFLRRRTGSVAPTPLAMNHPIGPGALAQRMVLGIEFLRVVAFPPCSLAIFLRQPAIIGHAHLVTLGVVATRRFVPRPGMVGMERDAEGQTCLFGSCCPSCQDVLVRADVHRIPALVLAVPEVEVIVMIAQREEILCANFLVELHQRIRIPAFSLEEGQDVLEAHL